MGVKIPTKVPAYPDEARKLPYCVRCPDLYVRVGNGREGFSLFRFSKLFIVRVHRAEMFTNSGVWKADDGRKLELCGV